MRILIAEDEVTIARVLKVMLEKNKYAVDMVHNGSDALDYIQAVGYDALVLDIMMPGNDGIEVLKADRAEGNTTPALFLTAKAEVADRVVGLDAGADDYLPKPFAANEFLARVRALTRRSNTYASFALSFGNVTLDCCQYLLKTAFEEVWLNNKEFLVRRPAERKAVSAGRLPKPGVVPISRRVVDGQGMAAQGQQQGAEG